MEFTQDHRLFLETVCRYFHDNGRWPTYDEVEQALVDHEDFDVVEVGQELDAFLHDGLHTPLNEWSMGDEVYISLTAIHTCQVDGIYPPLKEDFDVFMPVVHVCVEKYRAVGRQAKLSLRDVTDLIGPSPEMQRKVFLLASLARITNGSSYNDGRHGQDLYWEFGIARVILKYRNAATIDDFISIREELLAKDRQMQPVAYADTLDVAQLAPSGTRELHPIPLLPAGPFTVIETSCFVLMPFTEAMRPVYDSAILPAATHLGLECHRADEIFRPGGIMTQVWQSLMEARVVIADLTEMNPNVFYELGLAHTIGHDVIMITQDMKFVPFDLRHMRCFTYEPSTSGIQLLEQLLHTILQEVLDEV